MRVLVLLISFALCLSPANAQHAEDKLRVAIISKMTEAQREVFRDKLTETNPRIDRAYQPKDFGDTDAAIFILSSWDELPIVPGARTFPHVWEEIKDTSSPTVKNTILFTHNGDVPLTFVFYSIEDARTNRLECFAIDAAFEVGRTGTWKNDLLLQCRRARDGE